MPADDLFFADLPAAEIVHGVADHLAGRRVRLTWGDLDGVWDGMVLVLGVALIDGDVVLRVDIPVTDPDGDWEVYVGWLDLLAIGRAPHCDPPYDLYKRMITASRWFGQQVDITQCDRTRIVGTVTGFEVSDDGTDIDLILIPTTDEPVTDYPERLVLLAAIDTVVVLDP